MSFMSLIAILPINSFWPLSNEIFGYRGIPGYAVLEKWATVRYFTAVLVVHSFYAVNARRLRASGAPGC